MAIQTANKTPNLGLASPVASDAFTIDDFATSNAILDQNPGTSVVPNFASLPIGWGPAQHGRLVWQADMNVTWVWAQPSGSQSGSWQRTYRKGLLGSVAINDTFSTSNVGVYSGLRILKLNVTTPAKSRLLYKFGFKWTANAGGVMGAGLWVNNVLQDEMFFQGYGFNQGKENPPGTHFGLTGGSYNSETNLVVELSIHAVDPKLWPAMYSKGGTVAFPRLYVEDV